MSIKDIREAYKAGYEKGHNDTVESAYSPEQSLDDYIEELGSLEKSRADKKCEGCSGPEYSLPAECMECKLRKYAWHSSKR